MDNKKSGHVMIDLETLDTQRTAVILAIAAVEFNLETGETGRNFYKKIDIVSSLQYNRTIGGDTLKWWLNQPKETLAEQLNNAEHYGKVMRDFIDFLNQFDAETQIWANGISFDLHIIKSATIFFDNDVIKFWQERDVRTLVSLNPSIKENMTFEGTAHNALADCMHQIRFCSKIYQSLNISTGFNARL